MRVLFLESDPKWINGLPNGFRDAGHEVMVSGPLIRENILKMILEFEPELIISIGWTNETIGKKADWIRKYIKPSNIPYIYWATEDPGYTQRFSLPFVRKTKPDFVFTICAERVDYYKEKGFKAVHMDFAYHESIHCSTKCENRYKTNIAVVANGYPHLLRKQPEHFRFKTIRTLIQPIIKENIDIDFWGEDWDRINSLLNLNIPLDCIHGYLPYTDANKVYNSADIVIGIQNHLTQLTQRTYEVLGSEGFLFTFDTPAVSEFFKPGDDLIVSSSPEETIKLVRYYLNNPDEREMIRKNGKKAVEKHSYMERAKYIIEVLKKEGILP